MIASSVVLIDEDNNRLDIDVTIKESKNYENVITSYPVEDGSEVTDNVIKKNKRITITGIISQTPLVIGKLDTKPDVKLFDIKNQVKNFFGFELPIDAIKFIAPEVSYTTNVLDGRNFLDNLRDNFVKFTIQCRHVVDNTRQIFETFDDCIVKSLNYDADSSTGLDLNFTLVAEQITIARSKLASVKVKHADRAAKKVDKGHHSPITPTPDPANTSDSLSFIRGN